MTSVSSAAALAMPSAGTAYTTTYFAGGALGSAASALAFGRAGWPGMCLLGGVLGAPAGALWLAERPSRRG